MFGPSLTKEGRMELRRYGALFTCLASRAVHIECTCSMDTDTFTGLLTNILCAGNKSPLQRGFFTNSAGDLLPTIAFLGGLYNFLNFVIIFSLM